MKKLLLLSILLFSFCVMRGGTILNVHQKSGGIVSYSFSDKPNATMSGDNLVLKTSNVTVEYPISNLEKFTFSSETDGIAPIVDKSKSLDVISIYSISGKLIKTIKPVEGRLSVDTSELERGTYIVKNGSITYKIYKK